MVKGENGGYQHFLLFPQCFQKILFSGSLKVGIASITKIILTICCFQPTNFPNVDRIPKGTLAANCELELQDLMKQIDKLQAEKKKEWEREKEGLQSRLGIREKECQMQKSTLEQKHKEVHRLSTCGRKLLKIMWKIRRICWIQAFPIFMSPHG